MLQRRAAAALAVAASSFGIGTTLLVASDAGAASGLATAKNSPTLERLLGLHAAIAAPIR